MDKVLGLVRELVGALLKERGGLHTGLLRTAAELVEHRHFERLLLKWQCLESRM